MVDAQIEGIPPVAVEKEAARLPRPLLVPPQAARHEFVLEELKKVDGTREEPPP